MSEPTIDYVREMVEQFAAIRAPETSVDAMAWRALLRRMEADEASSPNLKDAWSVHMKVLIEHVSGLTRKWPLKSGQYITGEELKRLMTHPGSMLLGRFAAVRAKDDIAVFELILTWLRKRSEQHRADGWGDVADEDLRVAAFIEKARCVR